MFVIRGLFKNEKCFFQYIFYDKNLHMEVLQMTTDIKTATYYYSKKDAQFICDKYGSRNLKVVAFCPICKQDYDGYPAISRVDNETEICPECGMRQALDIYNKNTQ